MLELLTYHLPNIIALSGTGIDRPGADFVVSDMIGLGGQR